MSVSTITSPCIRSCCLGLDDVCMGCGRHLSEITGWQASSDDQKHLIIQRASERLSVKQESKSQSITKRVPE